MWNWCTQDFPVGFPPPPPLFHVWLELPICRASQMSPLVPRVVSLFLCHWVTWRHPVTFPSRWTMARRLLSHCRCFDGGCSSSSPLPTPSQPPPNPLVSTPLPVVGSGEVCHPFQLFKQGRVEILNCLFLCVCCFLPHCDEYLISGRRIDSHQLKWETVGWKNPRKILEKSPQHPESWYLNKEREKMERVNEEAQDETEWSCRSSDKSGSVLIGP